MKRATLLSILYLVLGVALPCFAATSPIDPSRSIDWSKAGIPGGIPNRTTICATISATIYGNGTTDATTAIQTALNSCPANQVVYLPSGTYRINSSLYVPSNVTLRGNGPNNTKIDAHGSSAAVISFGQGVTPSISRSIAITGGTTVGSNNIIVSNAGGITVGSYLLITQLNDPSFVTIAGGDGNCTWCDGGLGWNGTRVLGQIVEVTSVNGTNIGINPSLYLTYSSALSPLATPFAASAKYAGVEDLQVYMNNTGYTANLRMDGAAYCWMKNIESNYTDGDHMQAFWSYRGEIRDSYFHDAYHHAPGSTDADVFIANKSSGFLVENNIFRRQHVSIMLNWGAAGNVVAYNYSSGNFDESNQNFMIADLSSHGAHPMFNLWEGNIATSFNPDSIWGSSSHNTAFRNWFKGTTQVCQPLIGRSALSDCSWAVQANRAVNIDFLGRYYNFVGNVVGSTDMLQLTFYNNGTTVLPADPLIVAPQTRSYDTETYGYSFGYGGAGAGDDGSYPRDNALPYTTAFIHGDYNYANQSITWDPSIGSQALPASLYLSSKPSWFGNIAWPPIGPDVTAGQDSSGHASLIPAKVCFDNTPRDNNGNLTFNAKTCYGISSSPVTALSPPTNLRVLQ
jgi:hypothetical protein